jgi:argininosuccinate lyase
MAFSPEYVRLVLRENFEDAQALLLDPLMAIHEAHLAMLAECALITRADALALRAALAGIDRTAVAAAQYDPSVEDLFYYVDRLIAGACGPDVAGRLHTARSRNDIDMTMYRMRLREAVLDLGRAVASLRETLIAIGRAHLETVFPAHTHGQPAQPTTLAH